MMLVVGLGNPGKDYEQTRHNIGFKTVDACVHRFSLEPFKQKFNALLAEGVIDGKKVIILKPQTFMNLSGQSVTRVMQFYKIPVESVIVIHDDLDLPLGKVRVKQGGGHGGHNGLRSIDSHCSKNYWRVRIGIDHPGDKDDVSPYVLSRFAKREEAEVERVTDDVAYYLPILLSGDASLFMTKLSD
jgi:PTH1 family peptidyl-tRNA hydrolase